MDRHVTITSAGSLAGTLLTIEGAGFGSNASDVSVLVDGLPCMLRKINDTEILCRSPPFSEDRDAYVQARKEPCSFDAMACCWGLSFHSLSREVVSSAKQQDQCRLSRCMLFGVFSSKETQSVQRSESLGLARTRQDTSLACCTAGVYWLLPAGLRPASGEGHSCGRPSQAACCWPCALCCGFNC